jgi:hypothetical protein
MSAALSQGNNDNYLIKIFEGKYDELGVKCGYVDSKGDTVIPFGEYYYCYTDTLRNFAVVLKNKGGLAAIDKNDKELFEVFWYDNGPDHIADGLFRIIKNGKIGYANNIGIIVIEPQFYCAFPFEDGRAKVSLDCNSTSDGDHSKWESDKWFYINKEGQEIN